MSFLRSRILLQGSHALALGFLLLIVVSLIAETFWADDGSFSFAAWSNVFADVDRWGALLTNSLSALAIALASCLPIALFLATFAFRVTSRLRPWLVGLLVFGALLPFYVTNSSWITGMGVMYAESIIALGLVHGVASIPLASVLIGLSLRSVPRELEETAQLAGASLASIVLRVSLRSAPGGLLASAAWITLGILTDYSASDLLRVRTFAEETYTLFALHQDAREPTLVCLPQIVLFSLFLFPFVGRFAERSSGAPARLAPLAFRLGRWQLPATLAALALSLLCAGYPIVYLSGKLEASKSLLHYLEVTGPEILTSIGTAFVTGLLAAIFAPKCAWALVRGRGFLRWLTLSAIVTGLALPAPLVGMALISLFNHPGVLGEVYDSRAILVIAYFVRFFPLAVLAAVPAIAAIPRRIEDAAILDGADDATIWWRVLLPLARRATLGSFLFVSTLALGELPASQLVKPPGYETVGTRYFSLVHYGIEGDAAALCLLSACSAAALTVALLATFRKHLRG
ncbi:MAG: ABC transporter permease subunit [Planctomycetota bacterium]